MPNPENLANKQRPARWGQDRRLEFIDFRLLWEGRINRADLTSFFGISVPQASLDLAKYQEKAPSNLEYDNREKVYVASSTFVPLFAAGESEQYLNQLVAINSGMMSREMSFLGWCPEFDAVLSPVRTINPANLFKVLKAIRTKTQLEIEYQSFNRSSPTIRKITPHAIAYDGFRWHTRAFCHEHNDFRDFVFARMSALSDLGPSTADASQDSQWFNFLKLVLAPHPELAPEQQQAIMLDYGMKHGSVTLECREALLFYMLQRLRLDDTRPKTPQAQQIVLINRQELEPYLPKRIALEFKVGDLVRLKSGGPVMTVEQIGRIAQSESDGVWCVWFERIGNKEVVQRDTFPSVALEVASMPRMESVSLPGGRKTQ